MNLEDVIFTENLPTIDLHGLASVCAKIRINEFIHDNKVMKNSIVVIVHGIGSGVIRNVTFETLKKNKNVEDYRLFYNNSGMTIVKIKIDKN